MNVNQKAEFARLKVEMRAIETGITVSRPVSEGGRYDCVLDQSGKLYRAQIKYSDWKSTHSDGSVTVRLRSSPRQGAGRCYGEDEVDVLLVYLPKIDRICWIPKSLFCNKPFLTIRYEPARNGQTKGSLLAEDYLW